MVESEIVIVGGGIAGSSAAFHLASQGRRVVLLERGEIASAASGQNMGGIDSYGWGDAPDLQAHLTAGSLEIFETVQTDLGEDIEFRRSGGIQGIRTREEYEWERERVETLRKRGQVAELLTTREARSIEPGFSPALLGAMYSPKRGQGGSGEGDAGVRAAGGAPWRARADQPRSHDSRAPGRRLCHRHVGR